MYDYNELFVSNFVDFLGMEKLQFWCNCCHNGILQLLYYLNNPVKTSSSFCTKRLLIKENGKNSRIQNSYMRTTHQRDMMIVNSSKNLVLLFPVRLVAVGLTRHKLIAIHAFQISVDQNQKALVS